MGFTFVTIFIGFVASFVGYLYKENQRLREIEKNTVVKELNVVKDNQNKTHELIISQKVSVSVLAEKVDILEQKVKHSNEEIKEIKSLILSEPELKLMIKENL